MSIFYDLRSFRNDNNLTQKDVADIFSCTQTNISLIEKGVRPLTGENLEILIEKFGEDVVLKHRKEKDDEDPELHSMDNGYSYIYGNSNHNMYNGLLDIIKKQQEQISTFQSQITKFQEQNDSIIRIILNITNNANK